MDENNFFNKPMRFSEDRTLLINSGQDVGDFPELRTLMERQDDRIVLS